MDETYSGAAWKAAHRVFESGVAVYWVWDGPPGGGRGGPDSGARDGVASGEGDTFRDAVVACLGAYLSSLFPRGGNGGV